jgi:hypothetical protein
MGIRNVEVPAGSITAHTAEVRWNTTDDSGAPQDASTELKLCKVDPNTGTCTPTAQPAQGSNTSSHIYKLSNLDAGSEYIVVAVSRADGESLSCDSVAGDPTPCTKRFPTPEDIGDVTDITVSPTSARTNVGVAVELTITARVGSVSAPDGREVDFTITNGQGIVRGHFEPDPGKTEGGAGVAKVSFVPEHLGKAKILVTCQKAAPKPVEIEVVA